MESPSIERVEPRKTGYQMLDIVSSVCALLISFISIYMAYDNGRDMQKLVHANSWPALQMSSGNSSDEGTHQIGFYLHNAGVGPARIHSFEYVVDGRSISDGYMLERIAEACCAEVLRGAQQKRGQGRESLGDNNSRPIANTFLSPGEDTVAMRWSLTDTNGDIWHAVDRARQEGRLSMRACYCSVFDECWVAEARTFPPRQVERCPVIAPEPLVRPASAAQAAR